jgi:ABC-type transport system involved in multi-copper enzyme maturation permease subunit
VVFAALSVALLVGPVAFHRIVFRQHEKEQLLRAANIMAGAGLMAVALAVSGAVLLIMSYVSSGIAASILTLVVVLTFVIVWLVIPLATRLRGRRRPMSQ